MKNIDIVLFEGYCHIPDDFTGICKTKLDSAIRFFKDGKPHREDGAAIIKNDSRKFGKSHSTIYANDFTNS